MRASAVVLRFALLAQRRCGGFINSQGSIRRARAMRPKTVTLADTAALSIEPKYRALSPALSASSSWVNSCAWRSRCKLIAMALFKSMAQRANTAGTIFPGTIVPIHIESSIVYGVRLGDNRRPRSFGNDPVTKAFFAALVAMLTATSTFAQDPQAVMNMLLQRQMQQYELSHQNQMMRQELERRELEEKLRLSRASDHQIAEELARYCRNGEPPCWRTPPDSLLDEAARRGLAQYSSPQPTSRAPGQDCMVIGLGVGDATIDCR